MGKIIVYMPNLKNGHPTLNRIMQELADGFKKLGRDIVIIDLQDINQIKNAYNLMNDGLVDFSVGLNATVSHYTLNNVSMYNYLDTPYVSIMLDAPYNLTTGNIGFKCKKHFVCVLDKSHLNLIDYLHPDKHFWGKMFLPLGGISSNSEDDVFSQEREYDVVVLSNNCGDIVNNKNWHDPIVPRFYRNILDDVVDYLLANTVSIDEGFKHVLECRGLYDDRYRKVLLPSYNDVLWYVKGMRRIKSVEYLLNNDIKVDFFGGGWEECSLFSNSNKKNVRFHGMVSYQEVIDVTANAKIVYQDQAEFNNGAHDRVFTSMLNGAVVVSEYSKYLDEEFVNGQDLFLYDWKNGINQVKVVDELLNDESKRLSVAISAYGKASKKHRWVNRAESIIEAIELLKL